MPSLLEDLGIVETALGDIASFAAGSPINAKVDGYALSVQVLPTGPTPPYQTISGSTMQILFTVLALASEFSAGAPIALAVKENVTWYGVTIAKPIATGLPSTSALSSSGV